MKTCITLPDKLYKRLRKYAFTEMETQSHITELALVEFIAKYDTPEGRLLKALERRKSDV